MKKPAHGWICLGVAAALLAACRTDESGRAHASRDEEAADKAGRVAENVKRSRVMSGKKYDKPTDKELRARLTPLEIEVTQNDGTEPPFRNKFWDNHEAGIYVDVVTGEPLFSSRDKFESGTGWPSFTQPIEPDRVVARGDDSHGMSRTEVRSNGGDSHLGHLFDDGPAPTGQRYCINSAALDFVPVADLEGKGYGAYRAMFEAKPDAKAGKAETGKAPVPVKMVSSEKLETAILAGGCFWGMQDILRKIPGVVSTEVGYAGGMMPRPSYEDVKSGDTGHAESVKVVFDPKKLSYDDLLEKWFFRMHDPTTVNQQGNDRGTQYRSVIFFTTPQQKQIATAVKARVEKSGKWKRPIVTEITPARPFTRAEEYHQDYLEKHPGGYTCHYMRD